MCRDVLRKSDRLPALRNLRIVLDAEQLFQNRVVIVHGFYVLAHYLYKTVHTILDEVLHNANFLYVLRLSRQLSVYCEEQLLYERGFRLCNLRDSLLNGLAKHFTFVDELVAELKSFDDKRPTVNNFWDLLHDHLLLLLLLSDQIP